MKTQTGNSVGLLSVVVLMDSKTLKRWVMKNGDHLFANITMELMSCA